MLKSNQKTIIYHVIFWVAYLLLGNILEYTQNPDIYFFSLGDIIFSQLPNICTVYLCILVCLKFANPLRPFLLALGIILVFSFSFAFWYVTSHHIRPYIKANGPTPPQFNFLHYGAVVLWVFIRYSILGFGYYYASNGIKYQKQLRLLEKEKHEAEYAFLRAQINPHFLNNTLNFFFAKSLPLSEELANGIMTLSEIMRYSLEVNKEDGLSLAEDEIKHIENVIKINQLRFNHKLQIEFNIKGNNNEIKIIPLILITIVENILKHGYCTDKKNPVKIDLEFNQEHKMLHLKTWNLKKNGPKELSSGIGLDNIKKRLSHHYKNFILEINEDDREYNLELAMPTHIIESSEAKSSSQNINIFNEIQLQIIKPNPTIT